MSIQVLDAPTLVGVMPLGPRGAQGTPGGNTWASAASAAADTIPATLTFIATMGFAALGDRGGAGYVRRSAAPSHPGYFQSADGAYWEIAEPIIAPEMIGVVGAADDSVTVRNADLVCTAIGADLELRKPHKLGSAVSFVNHVRFRSRARLTPAANVTLDFQASFTADPLQPIFDFTASGSGFLLVSYTLRPCLISLRNFVGADPFGSADSTVAVRQWWAAAMTCFGSTLYLPAGVYKTTDAIDLDMAGHRSGYGFKMHGDGMLNSRLYGTGEGNPRFRFLCSGAADEAHQVGFYFCDFRDFAVSGDTSGIVYQIGQDNLADALNSATWQNCWFGNYNTAQNDSAVAVRINEIVCCGFLNCTFGNVKAGVGTAMQLFLACFSTFVHCSWGNCRICNHYTDGGNPSVTGFSYGVEYMPIDAENCVNVFLMEAANTQNIHVRGGQMDPTLSGYAIVSSKGVGGYGRVLTIEGVLFSDNARLYATDTEPATALDPSYCLGVLIRGHYGVNKWAPTVPSSGIVIQNTAGQVQIVTMWNCLISSVGNGEDGVSFNYKSMTTQQLVTIVLDPGEYLVVNYSGTLFWEWSPLK